MRYFEPDVNKLHKTGVDAPGSFIAWLSAQTSVYAYEMPGRRFGIGNLASYEEVQKTYKGIEK